VEKVSRLIAALEESYRKKTPQSYQLFQRAERVMIKGGSHTLRIFSPYPFFISRAEGASVSDVDGNSYIDFWQGHYANILGHNPAFIRGKMALLQREGALHTGFEDEAQIELAELMLRQLGCEDYKVRFTTSGTLVTMYSIMLARAYTGREYILKVGGGWHGASPFLLKGVNYTADLGFEGMESAGLPPEMVDKILVTRFNDTEGLVSLVKAKGREIAAFILEPFLGVGGFFPASREYLDTARRLTEEYGIVLIFDEIISGFRFCPSGAQKLYGIRPDLSTFGKLIGGGHAVSAVVGKSPIMEKCESAFPASQRVLFEGGTFSSHPEYIRAGLLMLKHLIEQADSVYPRLAAAGEKLRQGIERVFGEQGIEARCTGYGNEVVQGSSLFTVNFPIRKVRYRWPEEVKNKEISDIRLKEEVLKLALLTEGVHIVHGGGAVSYAHDDEHLEKTIAAYSEAARHFKQYLV
jgi:glutamate-1-semialdehyde 2,1-aminomutase